MLYPNPQPHLLDLPLVLTLPIPKHHPAFVPHIAHVDLAPFPSRMRRVRRYNLVHHGILTPHEIRHVLART